MLYKSNVSGVFKENDDVTLKTNDGRYFRFSGEAAALINECLRIKTWSEASNDQNDFLENTLLPKRIFLNDNDNTDFSGKKTPKLTSHVEVFKPGFTNFISYFFLFLFNRWVSIAVLFSIFYFNSNYLVSNLDRVEYSFLFSYSFEQFAIVLLLILSCSIFHEFGHSTACRKFSGRSGGVGFGLNVFIPVFYANVSDIHLISKNKRVIVALSGVYFQMIFATVLILMPISSLSIDKFLLLNYLVVFSNLIPLYRNDGYWALNDWINKSDIMKESFLLAKSHRKLSFLNGAVLVFGLLTIILFSILIIRFSLFVGPSVIFSFINSTSYDFSVLTPVFFVLSFYSAIFYLMIKVVLYFIRGSHVRNDF